MVWEKDSVFVAGHHRIKPLMWDFYFCKHYSSCSFTYTSVIPPLSVFVKTFFTLLLLVGFIDSMMDLTCNLGLGWSSYMIVAMGIVSHIILIISVARLLKIRLAFYYFFFQDTTCYSWRIKGR